MPIAPPEMGTPVPYIPAAVNFFLLRLCEILPRISHRRDRCRAFSSVNQSNPTARHRDLIIERILVTPRCDQSPLHLRRDLRLYAV